MVFALVISSRSYAYAIVSYSHNYEYTNLHLRVDDAGVLALAVDVVDLGHEVVVPEVRVHDVVHVHGEDVEKTLEKNRCLIKRKLCMFNGA